MQNKIIVIVLLVMIFIYVFYWNQQEGYSQAALLQLVAKGPQDTYLTGDAWKYAFYGPYGYYGAGYPWNYAHSYSYPYSYSYLSRYPFWNASTRIPRKYRYTYSYRQPWYKFW